MFVLDTDHLTEYQRGASPEAHRLKERLDQTAEPYAATIISVEEIMRGWMAAVRRIHDPHRQVNVFRLLCHLVRPGLGRCRRRSVPVAPTSQGSRRHDGP